MEVICPKCKHIWETKSEMIWVTCPSCQIKTKIREIREEDVVWMVDNPYKKKAERKELEKNKEEKDGSD